MFFNDKVLDLIQAKMDDFVDEFEEGLYNFENIPSGYGGCELAVDVNDENDLRLTIKIGSDDPNALESFDGNDLIDEILDSHFELDLDNILREFEITSANIQYTIYKYLIQ